MVWATKPPLGTQLDWTNPLNNGLVGFWLFNEGMGDKVNDLSGNANTGTLTGMAFPSTTISGWNPGRLGPAITFDGANDYVGIPTINLGIQNTLMLYAKYGTSDTSRAIPLGSGEVTRYYFYRYSDGSMYFKLNNDGTGYSYDAPLNIWLMLAWVRNNTEAKLYVDGNFHSTQTNANWNNIDTIIAEIGRTYGGVYPFNGTIDEVRIWNRALSASEIMELYINPYGMFLELGCPEILCTLNVI